MGQVQIWMTPHGYMQHSRNLPRKDVWILRWSRHSTFLHRWPFACSKIVLDRTSYWTRRYAHPPPEGWSEGQSQQIMLWRPQIWLIGLSRHSWWGYACTKAFWYRSSPSSPKTSHTIASVYQNVQLISWHVEKVLWASYPISCLNFQKRQRQLERRAQFVLML